MSELTQTCFQHNIADGTRNSLGKMAPIKVIINGSLKQKFIKDDLLNEITIF